MKPTTLLIASCAFVAGLGIGLSGPAAKAGEGLVQLLTDSMSLPARPVLLTVSASTLHSGVEPANFRWTARGPALDQAFCAAKPDLSTLRQPNIQHL